MTSPGPAHFELQGYSPQDKPGVWVRLTPGSLRLEQHRYSGFGCVETLSSLSACQNAPCV